MDVALSAYQSADAALGDVAPRRRPRSTRPARSSPACRSCGQALDQQLLTQDAITGKYTAMITSLLNINRQIGVGTDSTELNNEVAGLTALGDLKETLSQERALLYGVTSNGGVARLGRRQAPAAGSSSGSRSSSPRPSPSGWPRCSGSGPTATPSQVGAVRRAGQRPGRAGGQAARGQHHRASRTRRA